MIVKNKKNSNYYNSKNKNVFLTNERRARIIPALLVSLGLPFMFFIVSPLEVFSNGIEEFTFGVFDFIWVLLLFDFGASAIFFSLLFLTPKKVYRIIYAFLLALFLLLFLQLNFLNGNLSSLAGDDTSKTQVETWRLILNTAVWIFALSIAVSAFLIVKRRDIKGIVCLMLSFALIASQLINFLIILSSTGSSKSPYEKMQAEDKDFVPTFLTEQNFTTLSKNKNVIIFCIDRFDAELYADTSLQNERFKKYYEQLNGFTYYSDNVSMYARTYPSVCYMLTDIENDGVKTNGNTDRKTYLNYAYLNNKTLSTLDKNGYTVDIYTEVFDSYYNAFYFPNYVRNKESTDTDKISASITTANKFMLGIDLTEISAYRCFPYILKDLFGNVSSSTCNEVVKMNAKTLKYAEYSNDLLKAYQMISNNAFETEDTVGAFKFIHVTGCHNVPYDKNWNKTGNLQDSSGDIFDSLEHSLEIVTGYIDNMKKLGLYKDATIIITGDHSNVSNESGSTEGNYHPLDKERLTALFVKESGKGENSPTPLSKTNVSDKPVSHSDLWPTIFQSENISNYDKTEIDGLAVFNEIPATRERHYVFHVWNNPLHSAYTQIYYNIKGSGRNFNNWVLDKSKTLNFDRGYYD